MWWIFLAGHALLVHVQILTSVGQTFDAPACLVSLDPVYEGNLTDCSGVDLNHLSRLHGLPHNTTTLILDRTNITCLHGHFFSDTSLSSLRHLSIRESNLATIKVNALSGLRRLQILNLERNELPFCENKSFPPGMFNHVPELRHLFIGFNINYDDISSKCQTYDNNTDIFTRLPHLTNLTIDAVSGTLDLGDHFSNLTNLRNLTVVCNKVTYISNSSLRALRQLRLIVLNLVALHRADTPLESGAFQNLSHLQYLTVDGIHVSNHGILRALEPFANRSLTEIKLIRTNIFLTFNVPSAIFNDGIVDNDARFVASICVHHFSWINSLLFAIKPNTMTRINWPSCLQTLDLSRNKLENTGWLSVVFELNRLKKMRELTLSTINSPPSQDIPKLVHFSLSDEVKGLDETEDQIDHFNGTHKSVLLHERRRDKLAFHAQRLRQKTLSLRGGNNDHSPETLTSMRRDTDHSPQTMTFRGGNTDHSRQTMISRGDDTDHSRQTMISRGDDTEHSRQTMISRGDDTEHSRQTMISRGDDTEHSRQTMISRGDDTEHSRQTMISRGDDTEHSRQTMISRGDDTDHSRQTMISRGDDTEHSRQTMISRGDDIEHARQTMISRGLNTDYSRQTMMSWRRNTDYSRQTIPSRLGDTYHLRFPYNGNLTYYLPPSLQILKIINIVFASVTLEYWTVILASGNKLKEFYWINNELLRCHGAIYGLEKLKVAGLSGSEFDIADHFFDTFPSLEVLLLDNVKPDSFFQIHSLQRLLRNLTKLRYLDVSNNKLNSFQFHPDAFTSTPNITHAILSQNRFSNIPFNLKTTPNLRLLDLSNNAILFLTDQEMLSLNSHVARVKDFTLRLFGNGIACVCSQSRFFVWLYTTPVILDQTNSFECVTDDLQRVNVTDLDDLPDFIRLCEGRYFLLAAIILAFVMIVIFLVAYLVVRFKTSIEALLLRIFVRAFRPMRSEDYRIKVFIGYADEDVGYIRNILLKFLEGDLKLTTFVHHRDMVGGFSDQQFYDAISNSWRVLMVLSKSFLRSYSMSHIVMKYASHSVTAVNPHRVFVLLEETQMGAMPDYLHGMLEDTFVILLPNLQEPLSYQHKQMIKECLRPTQ